MRSRNSSCLSITPHRRSDIFFLGTSPAKKYTTDHELVVFDDATNVGTVSITNYAQSSLGDVVFVELPSKGTTVSQGGMSASHAF